MALVRRRDESIQYDGTNAAAVLAFFSDTTFNHETGGTLSFEENVSETSVEVGTNGWLVRSVRPDGRYAMSWMGTNEQYLSMWIEG